MFNAFTGGSFEQMSIFALSITPYITSSIIMQLLTIAIPKLEEMQKEGEDGRKKIVAITRYLTVALALIESLAMAVGFGRQGLLVEYNFVKRGNCSSDTYGRLRIPDVDWRENHGKRRWKWYFHRAGNQYHITNTKRYDFIVRTVCKGQADRIRALAVVIILAIIVALRRIRCYSPER